MQQYKYAIYNNRCLEIIPELMCCIGVKCAKLWHWGKGCQKNTIDRIKTKINKKQNIQKYSLYILCIIIIFYNIQYQKYKINTKAKTTKINTKNKQKTWYSCVIM